MRAMVKIKAKYKNNNGTNGDIDTEHGFARNKCLMLHFCMHSLDVLLFLHTRPNPRPLRRSFA